MKKYLIVVTGNSGYAEIYNVAIIHANSKEEAIDLFSKDMRRDKEGLEAFSIDDMLGNFYYYN